MPSVDHYVPRFYLRYFANGGGKVWVWDKLSDRVFLTAPENVACEKEFYTLSYLSEFGLSAPREMERQFSELESHAHHIFSRWIRQAAFDHHIEIHGSNREIIALFVVLQLFRTREARTQITEFIRRAFERSEAKSLLTDPNCLHTDFMWNGNYVNSLAAHVQDFIWVFGLNRSNTAFLTSDHPVQVKSGDSKSWIMGPRLYDDWIYLVYPLSPYLVLYMFEPRYRKKLGRFRDCVSPVVFDRSMVNHENSGQVGMSYRFVFSCSNDFEFARQFAREHAHVADLGRARFWRGEDSDLVNASPHA